MLYRTCVCPRGEYLTRYTPGTKYYSPGMQSDTLSVDSLDYRPLQSRPPMNAVLTPPREQTPPPMILEHAGRFRSMRGWYASWLWYAYHCSRKGKVNQCYRPQVEVCDRLALFSTGVCHVTGGVCLWSRGGCVVAVHPSPFLPAVHPMLPRQTKARIPRRRPPWSRSPSPGRPPWADTLPMADTPLGGRNSPTTSGQSGKQNISGRYASHWVMHSWYIDPRASCYVWRAFDIKFN